MQDSTVALALVSGILICLGLLFVVLAPAARRLAKIEVELTRLGGEEDQPAGPPDQRGVT